MWPLWRRWNVRTAVLIFFVDLVNVLGEVHVQRDAVPETEASKVHHDLALMLKQENEGRSESGERCARNYCG